MSKPLYVLDKLIDDLPQNSYHAITGTYSSSQFKDIIDSEEVFFKKYIEKSIEREHIGAFDVGSYFHTGVLEPHKLKEECAIFHGKQRRGEKWEAFQKLHAGKAILNENQMEQGKQLIRAVKKSTKAMGFINQGRPEISTFIELTVFNGRIYCQSKRLILDKDVGWKRITPAMLPGNQGVKIIVKVRADSLGKEFILDLKSTTGDAKSEKKIKDTISYYNYDLSASMYLDVFSATVGYPMKTFLWTFASKDYENCKTWQATQENILVGRAKFMKGVIRLAVGIGTGWNFPDTVSLIGPNSYELEHLRTDLTNITRRN